MESSDIILQKNIGKTNWNLSNQNITPQTLFSLLDKMKQSSCTTSIYLDLDGNRLGNLNVNDFKRIMQSLCSSELAHVNIRFGYDIFIPHYNKAFSEMSQEQQNMLKNRMSVDIHWDSPLLRNIESYTKTISESHKSLRGWQHHYDDSFETVITRCVKKYEEDVLHNDVQFLVNETQILNPEVPDLCEVDGLLFRVLDEKVHTIVFIEAKENMDSKMLKRANNCFKAFENYIRQINTVVLSNQRIKYRIQIQQFRDIINNNNDINIVKYLGAHNWPMFKNGQDSREEAIHQGWIIVERKSHEMYEILKNEKKTKLILL